MRWVDRMNLKDKIGGARQRSILLQRRDRLVRRADVNIERCDDSSSVPPGGRWPISMKRSRQASQADLGKAQRFAAGIGNEHGARSENAGRMPRRQRAEIGIDDRVLNLRQRGVRSLL